MTAISGDWLRRAVPALLISTALALGACSGSDSEPAPDEETTSAPAAEPTADQAALDQAALEKLATDLWAARATAYNSGEASAAMFADLLAPGLIEVELGEVSRYRDLKVLRTGAPTITSVEAIPAGDTAEILMCLDEDDWPFEEDGKPLPGSDQGVKPWGAAAERSGDRWIVTEELLAADVEGKKSC